MIEKIKFVPPEEIPSEIKRPIPDECINVENMNIKELAEHIRGQMIEETMQLFVLHLNDNHVQITTESAVQLNKLLLEMDLTMDSNHNGIRVFKV